MDLNQIIEEALARLDGAPVVVHGAGLTDAGVHALGQVASGRVATAHQPLVIRRALNAVLPGDVRVVAVEDAAPEFHARYSALGKAYEYRIWQGDVQPPFARAWSWHLPRPLDVDAMDRAARLLEGRHDCSAFQSAGSRVVSAVRTVAHARVDARVAPPETAGEAGARGRLVIVRLEADGFLRHMVRAVVGTLVEVGERRRDEASVAALLTSRDRAAAGAWFRVSMRINFLGASPRGWRQFAKPRRARSSPLTARLSAVHSTGDLARRRCSWSALGR